jgi:hypothetical protein
VTLVSLLQIREDANKGVHVENLTEHEVSNSREAMQQLIEVKLIKITSLFLFIHLTEVCLLQHAAASLLVCNRD